MEQMNFFGGIIVTEQITYFLGANTPFGFHSLYNELYDPADGWHAYILKGGPGTGKSTFMKHIAQRCDEAGIAYEVIRCASDPASLDALRIPCAKICVADGTAPHVIDPQYPGAVETVLDLSRFWDGKALRSRREDILRLTNENSAQHKKCVRFLQAAESLSRDVRRLALSCVDTDKVERYASRLASRKFGTPRGTVGMEFKRFLSAVTPDGIFVHHNTLDTLCDETLIVDDPYGAVSGALLGCLRRYALGTGLDVISCPCVLHADCGPQHLIVPELRLAILTDNCYHHFEGTSTVHASRFTDSSLLKTHRSRISFSRRTERELLEEAAHASRSALAIHNELEEIYKSAMDFGAVAALAAQTAEEILAEIG